MTDHIAGTGKMAPLRIQRRRTRGWRMPANTVSVSRPGVFGNPWAVEKARQAGFTGTDREAQEMAVNFFRRAWDVDLPVIARGKLLVSSLRGKNLACWCRLCPTHASGKPLGVQCDTCEPCHADVLLSAANEDASNG